MGKPGHQYSVILVLKVHILLMQILMIT